MQGEYMVESLSWMQAIILGISQGLTEFLPVSSSAHTLIISRVMGWGDPGAAFTAVTQIGTEAAVIWYFREDILRILKAWFASLFRPAVRSQSDARMGWFVILGSLPIGILGVLLKSQVETAARNLWVVSSALIGMGIVLWIADRTARQVKEQDQIRPANAVAYGLGQALALIPGVSRSGATITAGLAMGFSREAATRYSFLLAIPAVLASALLEAKDIGSDAAANWPATLVATGVASVVGYVVIARLMHYVRTRTYTPFVIYRIALGLAVIGLLLTQVVTATA